MNSKMMNFQKLRVRDMQKQTTLVRQDNCLEMLQSEAENIRKWQVKMEIRLKEKEKEIGNSKQTIDNLRNSILEAKIENEKITKELHEEIKSRDSCFEKLESTRAMCILVKNEFGRLEETLNMCVDTSNRLREENEKKDMKIQKLTDDFTALTASMKQAGEVFGKEHDKLQESAQQKLCAASTELHVVKPQLASAQNENREKSNCIEELKIQISESEKRGRGLADARTKLQKTVSSMLSTIGELKTANEMNLQKSQNRLNEASDIIAEDKQTISNLNEQYVSAKQNWQGLEQDYQNAIAEGEREMDMLVSKLDELQLEKEQLVKNVEAGNADRGDLEALIKNLKIEMSQAVEEKETKIKNLQDEKESLEAEFEKCNKTLETQVHDKEKERKAVSNKVHKLEEDLASFTREIREKSDEISLNKEMIETKQNEITQLEKDKANLRDEIDQNKSLLETKQQEIGKLQEELQGEIIRLKSQEEDAEELKANLAKMKLESTGGAKKAKKIADDCKRWEKKAKDLTKTVEETKKKAEESKNRAQEEKEMLKEKLEGELEKLRGECENMKILHKGHDQENEKLLAQIRDTEKARADCDSKWTKKETEFKDELEKKEKAIRDCRSELHAYRGQLRDTEKMLTDEGKKMVEKNEKIEQQEKKIDDLEYDLKTRCTEIEDLKKKIVEAEKASKVQDCSISPNTFPHRQRSSQTQPEVKHIKEEPKDEVSISNKVPVQKHNTRKRDLNYLFNDTVEEMLSEVSFGSGVVDAVTFNRKRALTSSTPKQTADAIKMKFQPRPTTPLGHMHMKRPMAPTNMKSRVHGKSKKSSSIRKNKQTKKWIKKEGSLDWFDTDSVYGFHE